MLALSLSPLVVAALASLPHPATALSTPPDPFAHPRFALAFLNDLPIAKVEADALLLAQDRQRQQQGSSIGSQLSAGGGQPSEQQGAHADVGWFFGDRPIPPAVLALDGVVDPSLDPATASSSSGAQGSSSPALLPLANHTLQTFLLPPSRTYLCLLPPAPSSPPPPPPPPASAPPLDPALPAQLLKHLEGTCLYTRAGWFSYRYCHGREVVQFREGKRDWTNGGVPTVDERYDEYVLGRATVPPYGESFDSPSFHPSSAPLPAHSPDDEGEDEEDDDDDEEARPTAPYTTSRGAGARYLSTRWGGGTVCDRTGDAREIEIQYHCSPLGTDHLTLIKELATCVYVLRLETPRLCSIPGFDDDGGVGGKGVVGRVGCREVVDGLSPRRTVDGSQTSKDRTPLPSWALLPASDPPSTAQADRQSHQQLQQQQQHHHPLQQAQRTLTAEEEQTRDAWLAVLKRSTGMLNLHTTAAGGEAGVDDDDNDGRGQGGPAVEGGEPPAEAVLDLSAVLRAALDATADDDPAPHPDDDDPSAYVYDVALDDLTDDEFDLLFPDGVGLVDERGLVGVVYERLGGVEGGWTVRLAEEGEGEWESEEEVREGEEEQGGWEEARWRDEL